MDALTFGTTKLVRRLTDSEAKKRPCLEFDLAAVLEGMGLTMAQFIDVCILCGCDYCPSIRGIGPKTALAMIKKHGNIEGMLEAIAETSKYVVPENWRFEKARELLVERMNFDMTRVNRGIERLKACKKKGQQRRLDNFFKVMPSPAGKGKTKGAKGKAAKGGPLAGKKRRRNETGNTTNSGQPKNKRARQRSERGGGIVSEP